MAFKLPIPVLYAILKYVDNISQHKNQVKNMGKHVEVAYFESGVSKDLLNVADNRYLLNRSFFNGLWTRKRYARHRIATGDD